MMKLYLTKSGVRMPEVFDWKLCDIDGKAVNGGNFNHWSKCLKTEKTQRMLAGGVFDDVEILPDKQNKNKYTLVWVCIDGQYARTRDCSVGAVVAMLEAVEKGAGFDEAVDILETIALEDKNEDRLENHSILKVRNGAVPNSIELIEQQPQKVIELLNSYDNMYQTGGRYCLFNGSYLDETDVKVILRELKDKGNKEVIKQLMIYTNKIRG